MERESDCWDCELHLPNNEQSKKNYLRYQDQFRGWCAANSIEDEDVGEDAVGRFLKENLENGRFCPSTLYSVYSALKSMLHARPYLLDTDGWHRVQRFLKKKNYNYQGSKAKMFEPEEIVKYAKGLDLTKPNDLRDLSLLICYIHGLMRREEVTFILSEHVQFTEKEVRVTIPKSKHRPTEFEFAITDDFEVRILRKYAMIPRTVAEHRRFFRNYNLRARKLCQPTGMSRISAVVKDCAKANGVTGEDLKRYRTHSIRRTGGQLMAESGASCQEIRIAGRWKNTKTAQEYIENSRMMQRNNSARLTLGLNGAGATTPAPAPAPPVPGSVTPIAATVPGGILNPEPAAKRQKVSYVNSGNVTETRNIVVHCDTFILQ